MPTDDTSQDPAIGVLEKTLELNNSVILFTNSRGRITYVNPAFERRTGYTKAEVLGKNPNMLKSGGQSPEFYQNLWETILSGKTWTGHLQNRAKDGSLFWEDATIFPVLDGAGSISHFVAIKEDISQQKKAEQIMLCLGEANKLIVRSPDTRFVMPKILRTLGEGSGVEEVLMLRYEGPISHPEKRTLTVESSWSRKGPTDNSVSQRTRGRAFPVAPLAEWIGPLKAGQSLAKRVSDLPPDLHRLVSSEGARSLLLVPIRTEESLLGIIVFLDTAEACEWSDSVTSALSSVGSNIAIALQREAYQRDTQAALLKAEASALEAIQANRIKSDFLSVVSHELRTPLNGILGMTQILLEDEVSADKKEMLEIINSSGTSLEAILGDLLDFSKIEAGKLSITCRSFSIKNLVKETFNWHHRFAKEKSLEFKLDLKATLADQIVGDPDHIKQILSNLLSNALKFTEKGEIQVCAEIITGSSDSLLLSVQDSGIGIDSKIHDQVFNMFTQGDTGSRRQFGGTGLGLAICQRLTDEMGGRIWFEAVPTGGTCFYVSIPCSIEGACDLTTHAFEGPKRLASGSNAETGSAPSLNHFTVLVVDDEPVNQLVTRLQLKSLGYDCTTAQSGDEALKILENGERFDFILMDCEMPGMNGFETTSQIKERFEAAPPIIALSASASVYDRQQSLQVGMKDYLLKPVSKECLASAFEKCLSRAISS